MYVCRQVLNHPVGESEGLSLNEDLFLRIAHPRSRGGEGRGGGGQCQKFVTPLVCLLHPAEVE